MKHFLKAVKEYRPLLPTAAVVILCLWAWRVEDDPMLGWFAMLFMVLSLVSIAIETHANWRTARECAEISRIFEMTMAELEEELAERGFCVRRAAP